MRAFVGLGANLGDAKGALDAAFVSLASLPHTALCAASSLYRSAPVDAGGPDFLNAVVLLETRLTPSALLAAMQRIETAGGRVRSFRNAPRRIDLDLLLYGEKRISTTSLTVPHPRMHERAFVLLPLAEIMPTLTVVSGRRVRDLLAAVVEQRIERLIP